MSLDLIILTIAATAFAIVGYAGKRQSEMAPTSSLSVFRIGAGLAMAYVGGAATIAMAGIGYANGLVGFVDPIAVILGGAIVAYALRWTSLPKAGQGVSDFLANGDPVRKFVYAVCSLLVYVLLASAQIVALTKIFGTYIDGNSSYFVSLIIFLTISGYVYIGGIVAVTRTDISQFFVILLLFIVPSAIGLVNLQASQLALPPISQSPLDTKTIFLLSFSILFVPLSQDAWIRARRAKSIRSARFGLVLGVLIYGVIVGLAVIIGHHAATAGISVGSSESILPHFFKSQLGFAGVVPTIVLLAAIMSTLDSFTYNLTSTVSSDLWPTKLSGATEKGRRAIAGVCTFLVCAAIATVAQSILTLVLTALMIYVSVIGPGVLFQRYLTQPRSIWLPALMTLTLISVVTAAQIQMPFEPYIFIVIHVLVLCGFLLLERRTVNS
jgi:Na+/proline symporter